MKLNQSQITLLNEMLAEGYITVQQHPTAPLFIYNYTPKAQYEAVWNELTLMCRGLILNDEMEVVARPFNKFFNYSELAHKTLPNEPFEVFEKMDGSLGILYWLNGEPYIATRGSFTSVQAQKGKAMLLQLYAHLLATLDKNSTYLFEIIYPENRIVVNYGDAEDLVLIAIIDNRTGAELSIENTGFKAAKKYNNIANYKILHEAQRDNAEGYVVKFANNFRVKIKFEEYIRVHRIVTNVSSISIWEYLASNQAIDEIIEQVPDEFFNWVKSTVAELKEKFARIETQCKNDFKILPTQKESALYYQTCDYPHVLYAMYNNKKYNAIIWKMLRPKFAKPFTNKDYDH